MHPIGPWRRVAPLGEGGMGVVWRVVHTATGVEGALKTVRLARRDLVLGIRREIHALRSLDHPGVVRMLDDGVEEGRPWVVMELVDGRPLADHWPSTARSRAEATAAMSLGSAFTWTEDGDAPGALDAPRWASVAPLPAIATLVHRLLQTLAWLHGEGVVHRDLKPQNVLVRSDGRPVLVDFGLLARSEDGLGREVLDADAAVAGTPWYMAPEQIRGEPVDGRADLYAVGCMLVELLTGAPPYLGTALEVRSAHLAGGAPPPSARVEGLPDGTDALVRGLLAVRPFERAGDAREVASSLADVFGVPDEPFGPAPRRALLRAPLVDREAVLARLFEAVERLPGQGGLLALGGPEGAGRTRLLSEVVVHARQRGALVLVGRCAPGAPPLEAFREPVREIVERCADDTPERAARVIGAREPTLTAVRQGRPDAADEARVRLFADLSATLVAYAGSRGLVLALDDMQHADELSAAFLRELAPRLPRLPVVVVGAYDEQAAGLPHDAPILRIQPFAGAASGPSADEEAQARLAAVSPSAARVAAAAALLGPYAAAEPVSVVAAVDEGTLLGALAELSRERIAGLRGDRVHLATSALRRAALRQLGREASEWHARAAAALEAADADPAAIAFHWRDAGRVDRASPHVLAAVARARAAGAVRRVYELAFAFPPPDGSPEGSLDWLLTQGSAAHQCSRYDECAALAEQAVSRAEPLPARWRARAYELLGLALRYAAEPERAIAPGERAVQLARAVGDPTLLGETLETLAASWLRAGRHDQQRDRLREAIACYRTAGVRGVGMARALASLAKVSLPFDGVDAALALLGEASAHAGDNRVVRARVIGTRAILLARAGRNDEAEADFREATALFFAAEYPVAAATVLGNYGEFLRYVGRFTEAVAALEQTLAIREEYGDRELAGSARSQLGGALVELGRYGEAEPLLWAALAAAETSNRGDRTCQAMLPLAVLARRQGRYEEARARLARARQREYTDFACALEGEHVYVALARGEDPTPHLERMRRQHAHDLALGLRDFDPSPVEAAAEAAARGEPLVHGELPR